MYRSRLDKKKDVSVTAIKEWRETLDEMSTYWGKVKLKWVVPYREAVSEVWNYFEHHLPLQSDPIHFDIVPLPKSRY